MESDNPAERRMYRAVIDATIPPNYVLGSRKVEEEQAIEQLLDRYPAEDRARIKRDLLEAHHVSNFESADPEVARLFGIIASIRAADAALEDGR